MVDSIRVLIVLKSEYCCPCKRTDWYTIIVFAQFEFDFYDFIKYFFAFNKNTTAKTRL